MTIKELYQMLSQKYPRKKDPVKVATEYQALAITITGKEYDEDESKIIVLSFIKHHGIAALIDKAKRYGVNPVEEQLQLFEE